MAGLLLFIGHILLVVSLLPVSSESVAINDYILDYQPLQFNPSHLHDKHSRVKRAVDQHLQWSFKAYGRTFNLQLQPAKNIFADNHELVFDSEPPQIVDTSFAYQGHLAGDPSSTAYISIINGSISGHVVVPGHTTYHIEPARNHFNDAEFHTVIYPESRMNLDPYRHKRKTSETCGSKEIFDKLNKMSAPLESSNLRPKRQTYWESSSHNKYSAEANTAESWLRTKRDLRGNNRTCIMSLQADMLLYDHFVKKYRDKAKEEILSLFASHINALNDIYGSTLFPDPDPPRNSFGGVHFQLQRSKIITNCTAKDTVKRGFCEDNLDVSNFLELTAQDDFDQYCLVHTFTYRDFVGGTLGLAWVATPDSSQAGICGKYGANGGATKRSLNTGIVTLINFKQDVPPRVSQLTFAHEVGHNFGAQHDTTNECAPYGTGQPGAADGNYIMFPSATQGNLPNNRQFSSCSKKSIAKVLGTLGLQKRYCFEESDKPFCGNKIVEGSEECDCGFEDCDDICCQKSKDGDQSSGCKLNPGKICSPSQGPCCNSSCSLMSNNHECQAATDCTYSSYCDGVNATCPTPKPKEDKSFCNDFSKVCIEGECIGSVCEKIQWKECFLTSSEVSDVKQMCYVSCRKNDSSECISSNDKVKLDANPEYKNLTEIIGMQRVNSDGALGVKRPAGSPCNNYKGYCDVFSKCRNVDAEGPFRQLTDLIFNPVTLKKIRSWIEEHWWAVLLMSAGVIVFMGVFVKIFEYNTPSKNPKKKNQNPPSNRPQEASRPPQDKRSGAYSTDMPMRDRREHGRNQGYYNHAFQGPAPSQGPQQFDRISKTPRY